METRRFPASLHQLKEVILWIREEAKQIGFAPPDQRKIELGVEEALVNIILHAYREQEGIIEISLRSELHKELKIIFKDTGPYFNLLKRSQEEWPSSLEEREEGGLGILLIRSMMDETSYERIQGKNVLTLIKKIQS